MLSQKTALILIALITLSGCEINIFEKKETQPTDTDTESQTEDYGTAKNA